MTPASGAGDVTAPPRPPPPPPPPRSRSRSPLISPQPLRMSAPWVRAALLLSGVAASWAQTATPAPPPVSCSLKSNTSCYECLHIVTCLWCEATKQCVDYPVRNILPPSSVCPLTDARWGVCWVNFQVLIITMSVLAAAVVIALLLCCLCCCCRRNRAGRSREDVQLEQQNRARNSRQKARRTEMQLRHDEIRQKYGLAKQNPYSRMDGK